MLSEKLYKLIKEKFGDLTEVQRKAFRPLLEGKNVVICSETGSGKTEAALLPIIYKIAQLNLKGTKTIYITPLRALNRDIYERIAWWTKHFGLSVDIRHGDTPRKLRRNQLQNPPDILITTPENFQALITDQKNLLMLKNLRHIIIDEVNELIQSKRGIQLAVGLKRLELYLGLHPQTVFLSATIRSGKYILDFFGIKGEVIYFKNKRKYDLTIDIIPINNDLKIMSEIIKEKVQGKTLVFVNTRYLAEAFGKLFPENKSIEVHHGSLSLEQRLKAEEAIKTGQIKTVIATSSLELGLDIGKLEKVIQVGSPRTVVTLIQRIGRAGHRLIEESIGIIVASNPYELIEAAAISELALLGWLERPVCFKKPLDVLANQIAGHLLVKNEITKKELEKLFSCYAFKDLNSKDLDEVLNFLVRRGVIYQNGEILKRGKFAKKFFFENISLIPSDTQFSVKDIASKKIIGYLDNKFVERYCGEGSIMVLGKRKWEIIAIDYGVKTIDVKPTEKEATILPIWAGETLPVDKYVSKKMIDILRSREKMKLLTSKNIKLSERAQSCLANMTNIDLDKNSIYIIQTESSIILIAPLGTRGNRALALLLEFLLEQQGINVLSQTFSLGVVLIGKLSALKIKEILCSFEINKLFDFLSTAALSYGKYTDRMFAIAKRFGFNIDKLLNELGARRLYSILAETIVGKELLNELFSEILDVSELSRLLKHCSIKLVDKDSSLYSFAKIILTSFLDDSVTEKQTVLSLVKERLLSKTFHVYCLSCFRYKNKLSLLEINDSFRCPICDSKFLSFLTYVNEKTEEVLKKVQKNQTINDKEMIRIKNELIESANLYLNYGKKALVVLAGIGIGPATAKRILRKRIIEESELYTEILKAEELYIKTKEFWG